MNFQSLVSRISSVYDAVEARSIVKILLEDSYRLQFTDICLGALDSLSEAETRRLESDMMRLEQGEPVQYVVGSALFCGRRFNVEPGVLIPRPETEELVAWIKEDAPGIRGSRNGTKYILDIGCGSGCIGTTLALEIEKADVSAWDVSDTALRLTRSNARKLGTNVDIYMQDALSAPGGDVELWDVIVSNPPYICAKEAGKMERNVLDYEPHEALFVPDNDPLMFYRSIAEYAIHALRRGGILYFEINSAYGKDTVDLLKQTGFTDVILRKDAFGNDRMVRARM